MRCTVPTKVANRLVHRIGAARRRRRDCARCEASVAEGVRDAVQGGDRSRSLSGAPPSMTSLHRRSTGSFWRAVSRNGHGAPCAFTVDRRRSTNLWPPARSSSHGMFFVDSSTNPAYWAQRQRDLGADELVGPRERPKEGTTPAVKRPTSAAGSHPLPRLFGEGLPPRTQNQPYAGLTRPERPCSTVP